MSEPDVWLEIYRGNTDCIRIARLLQVVVSVWDDLIDKDKPVSDDDINAAFWALMVELPTVPLYVEHFHEIQPLIRVGILNWWASNELARDGSEVRAREIAHVLRYGITDVLVYLALIVGGREWAAKVAPRIKLLTQQSTLAEFRAEMEAKHG